MSSHGHRQQKSLRVAKTSKHFSTKVCQLYLMHLLWNKELRRETVELRGLSSLSFLSVLWGHLLLDHWYQKQTLDLNKQRTNSVRWCDDEVIYCLSNKNKHALMIMNKQLLLTKSQFINMYSRNWIKLLIFFWATVTMWRAMCPSPKSWTGAIKVRISF